MPDAPNYLLGYGERLAESVDIKFGGGEKKAPYPFSEARARLSVMAANTTAELKDLPDDACPGDEAVVSLTLHPEYLAKSYYPAGLLRAAGLRPVGSRARTVAPEKRSRNRQSIEAVTTQLFVAGTRTSFENFAHDLPSWTEAAPAAQHLTAIELIEPVTPADRIKHFHKHEDQIPLEVVLHASERKQDRYILKEFREYTKRLDLHPDFERLFFAGRLCFLRMYAPSEKTVAIARYAFLRVLREMPYLRTTKPSLRSRLHRPKTAALPTEPAFDTSPRVAIFDGGIPKNSRLKPWVNEHDVPGIGKSNSDLLWHGETVTSALLFGTVDTGKVERPACQIDHYRVIDEDSETDPFELYDVLERIKTVLSSRPYEFVSLSIGPVLPVDDDEIHAWTSVLDDELSGGDCLAAIAAGNTGDEPDDPVLQPWRIQVPSDCVNGLTVGASDRRGAPWARASYSSRGPGRSPGIVKPDVLAFGGSESEPFWVFDPDTPDRIIATAGTSYAAPAAMRTGASIRAQFGDVLGPLAIKALLIHRTQDNGHGRHEIGWGRLPDSLDEFTICPNTCVRVVYQDEISASKFRRVRIPIPNGLTGTVKISATLCFATAVEPQHAGNYTCSGLEIVFRPNMQDFKDKKSTQPKSGNFFQPAKLYAAEQELRKDAHKWETCLHMSKKKRASGLVDPVFDIHYVARTEGRDDDTPRRIRYALLVSIEAPRVRDLYSRVVRAFSGRLEILSPIRVPVRT